MTGGDWLDGYAGSWGEAAPARPAAHSPARARAIVEVVACPACASTQCKCTHRQADRQSSRWVCELCSHSWPDDLDAGRQRAWLA